MDSCSLRCRRSRNAKILLLHAAFFDAGLLAREGAEVVELGATHLTVLVDGDGIDEGRFDGEDTFYTDIVAHLADGEALLVAFAADADYNAAVLLDTLFVAFFDSVSYGDSVAGAEFGVLFARGKCLFGNFNQIHFLVCEFIC